MNEENTTPRPMLSFGRRRAAHLRLGRRGERLAARLLRELGLTVLAKNFRDSHGEIDIIARDGATLCFVEVKTRTKPGRARPAQAVGALKQKRLIRTARQYLREIGRPPLVHRYDIVEIILNGLRLHDIRHYPGAFNEQQQYQQRRSAR